MTRAEQLAQTRARLADYILAEAAILKGSQSYSIANRTLTRADIQYIKSEIDKLTILCVKLSRPRGMATRRRIPRDL